MSFSFSFLPASLLNSPEWIKNPYRAASEYANSVLAPKFPSWALGLLIAFVVMRVIFIIGCTSIISIPFFQGPFSRKKHLFLVHRAYPEKVLSLIWYPTGAVVVLSALSVQYVDWTSHRCMIVVICELFSSIFYLCGAWFSYRYNVEDARHGGPRQLMTLWYGISWLPSYVGIVLSSWGLGYACLCDVGGAKNRKFSKFMTPIVYNTIWISWTVIAIGTILYWSIVVVSVLSRLEDRLRNLFEMLDRAAVSWDAHHDFSKIPLTALYVDAISLFHDWSRVSLTMAGWGKIWVVLAIVLMCVLSLRELHSMTVSVEWNSPIWNELELEFRFLLRSSFVIGLSILAQIFEAIFQALSGSHLDSMTWRIAAALLTHLPGVFMAPALILQSWHIFSGRSVNESKYHTVSVSHKNSFMPQITSQLLGWDTNLGLGELEEEMKTLNFPGLLQVTKDKSDLGGIDKTPVNDQQIPNLDITITYSTVITQDKV